MAQDDAALLAAIAADPEDDAKRLVYADLLAERGDPRGEFIQVQCRQAASGNTPALQARAGELERAHGKAWREAAGIRDALTVFHRGFPFTLIGSCEAILASREALRTQPIVSLSAMSGFEKLGELLALPEVARLRELTIAPLLGDHGRRLPVPAELLAPLAATPHLARVTTLTFEPGALDEAGRASWPGRAGWRASRSWCWPTTRSARRPSRPSPLGSRRPPGCGSKVSSCAETGCAPSRRRACAGWRCSACPTRGSRAPTPSRSRARRCCGR